MNNPQVQQSLALNKPVRGPGKQLQCIGDSITVSLLKGTAPPPRSSAWAIWGHGKGVDKALGVERSSV